MRFLELRIESYRSWIMQRSVDVVNRCTVFMPHRTTIIQVTLTENEFVNSVSERHLYESYSTDVRCLMSGRRCQNPL